MTQNQATSDSIARYRAVLETLDPRLRLASKLRALFPIIETQVAAGVPHAAVLDDLAAVGLPVQRSTYVTTLYRWRKAQRSALMQTTLEPSPGADPAQPEPEPAPATQPLPPMDAIQGRPRNIQTPGDLRKIRDMRVDLEALRREGLAQRTKHAENTSTHQDKE
ncbi:hypothetical protein [Candidimonas nitroreducens]|jgi:hypothetical protein|uniref:Uncharacterized protein n=1 Tax=Candidimonas nitroreducens TaxID=683354 RepID=A0A225MW72_9BURK|nr:hypothetical protein [Candidimonas nitroreducens]OWT65546.1 hypothetical protein CEY11_02030 [Candidimonas nitroreducens]